MNNYEKMATRFGVRGLRDLYYEEIVGSRLSGRLNPVEGIKINKGKNNEVSMRLPLVQ